MFKTILIFSSLILSSIHGMHLQDAEIKTQFSSFIKQYEKNYSDDELITRFSIFKQNVQNIEKHNRENHSWKMEVNKFADLTSDEFKVSHLCYNNNKVFKNRLRFEDLHLDVSALPDELDWTEKGVVTSVNDQGQCGSCYAFSAVEAVESAYALETGKLVALSKQQIVDCSGSNGNQGCNGGLMDYCFDYIKSNGICKESDYGYKGVAGTCNNKCTSVTKVSSYVDVSPNNEQSLQQAVALQPVSVAIEADQMSFQFYSSGVLTATCGTNLDHGVLVVGYGTLNGQDYWKVRNSWGSSWGEQGYIRLARNVKSSSGQCGIAVEPSYPVINSQSVY
jgi:C1A family cysteine protease